VAACPVPSERRSALAHRHDRSAHGTILFTTNVRRILLHFLPQHPFASALPGSTKAGWQKDLGQKDGE
jgi:hypothetical protein